MRERETIIVSKMIMGNRSAERIYQQVLASLMPHLRDRLYPRTYLVSRRVSHQIISETIEEFGNG